MAYTPELREWIRKVEETRSRRLERKARGEEFPSLTLAERQERLRAYHPDYQGESRREVRVGPNKGYPVYHEIVDLLEAESRIDPEVVDLFEVAHETDVLVIGGGGAGTAAALVAQDKLRHGDANTMMAEGGIQAAERGSRDSPFYHYLDTMGGGHFKNVPQLVYRLVTEAPAVIQWLESLGVMLNKGPDGNFQLVHLGGTSRKRVHFASDITGAEIMRTLRDEAWHRGGVLHHKGKGRGDGYWGIRSAPFTGVYDHQPLRCHWGRVGDGI